MDFDGTLTNLEKEAFPFVKGYKKDIAKDLNVSETEFENIWYNAVSIVNKDLNKHGWEISGKIVAPSYADPFIHSMAVARVIFDKTGIFQNEEEKQNALTKYFNSNYNKLITSFKNDANEFLDSLKSLYNVCIVTNSKTDGVRNKIEKLNENHLDIEIYGDAKKYVLDNNWNEVEETVSKDNFGRELFLRRKKYWDVLSGIMNKYNLENNQVAVVGDIYELDLLLPEYKGMNIVLLPNKDTPQFEKDNVNKSLLGYVSDSLDGTFDYLKKLNDL